MTSNQVLADDCLQDKVLLITGAAQGFGAELSKKAASMGATVVLLDHQVKLLEKLYDDIVMQDWPEPAIYPFDFKGAKPDDYHTLVANIINTLGHLDQVIQNAATFRHLTPIVHHSIENWYEIMQVNINAPFLLTQACLGALDQEQQTALIFVDDKPRLDDMAFWGAYGVAKFALEGLMHTVSCEVESNTHCQVLCYDPGPLPTKLLSRIIPAAKIEDLPTMDNAIDDIMWLLACQSRTYHGMSLKKGFRKQ